MKNKEQLEKEFNDICNFISENIENEEILDSYIESNSERIEIVLDRLYEFIELDKKFKKHFIETKDIKFYWGD